MNDSTSLALYARMIIRLEEDRATQIVGRLNPTKGFAASDVPEEARFLDVVVSSGPETPGSFTLVGTRFMHECGGKIDLVKCRIGRDDPGGAAAADAHEIGMTGILVSPHSVELYSRAELMVTGMH